jgi:hypothetical protein
MVWFFNKKKEPDEPKMTPTQFKKFAQIAKEAQPYYDPADEFKKQVSAMREMQEIMHDFNEQEQERLSEAAQEIAAGGDNIENGILNTFLKIMANKFSSGSKAQISPPGQTAPLNPTLNNENIPDLPDAAKIVIDKALIEKIPENIRDRFKQMSPDEQKSVINYIVGKLNNG